MHTLYQNTQILKSDKNTWYHFINFYVTAFHSEMLAFYFCRGGWQKRRASLKPLKEQLSSGRAGGQMAPGRVRDTAGTPPAAAGEPCTARGRPGTGPTNSAKTPAGARRQTPAAHTAQPLPSQRPALPFHKMAATPPRPFPNMADRPPLAPSGGGISVPYPPSGAEDYITQRPPRGRSPRSPSRCAIRALSRESAAPGGRRQ